MSGFVDSEAEEELSDGDDFTGKKVLYDDSEDEEEDEKALEKETDEGGNIAGLVNDDDDDDDEEESAADADSDEAESEAEPEGEEVEQRKKKRKRDHRLEDDDFELIEENLGVKLKKRKKFSRLRTESSDEDEDVERVDDRDVIRDQLFQGDDIDEPSQEEVEQTAQDQPIIGEDEDEEGSDESDDGFIVDDNDEPIRPQKGQKRSRHGDSALQQVQDIFGVDFDFADVAKYGEDYGDDDEDELDDEAYYEDDIQDYDDDEQLRSTSETTLREAKKKRKKSRNKKSIFDVMEPETLERGFYTDKDAQIRSADIPERFQLRAIPVRPAEESELELEAEWIYKYCFIESTMSRQDIIDENFSSSSLSSLNRKPPSCIGKIQDTLNFMRNQQFEVPFIAFYRKEYVEPELNIHDLFKIYHWDEKWTQLNNRKANLTRLLHKMQTFQYEQISADPDKPLGDNVRALTDADIERIQAVQTMQEFCDVYNHFVLHYGRDIPKMQNALRLQRQREGGTQQGQAVQASDLKQASRKDMYTVCLNAGLGGMANKFGLTPEQFGENLRDNYQRHETEQYPAEPLDLAEDFVSTQFPTKAGVMEGARFMVAQQLAREPLVRQCVRQTYHERAKLSVRPTKKGKKEIDQQHDCFKFKWLRNKPVKDLMFSQFLHIHNAEKEGLLTVKMHIDMEEAVGGQTYFEEIKQLYYRDEFSHLVQEWNKQRSEVISFMLNTILYPEMGKEIKTILLQEARDGIKERCALRLRSHLSVAAYQLEENELDEDLHGAVCMGIAYSEERDTASFAAVVSGTGELEDYLKLNNLRLRAKSMFSEEAELKKNDMKALKEFIGKKKPHVIVIGVVDRFSLSLQDDVKACVTELEQEGGISNTAVHVMDNELAVLFASTQRAETYFRDFPSELRQAISLARRMQDPMLEFSQLCTSDQDLLCLKLHPLQDQVEKDSLMESLVEEFIFRACEVGVDVNRAITETHTATIVQFVCGLGPRKAAHLIKVLKQRSGRLENRSNLVTVCKMGPKIFINCAGFIKIDTKSMEDSMGYIEILDGLRVHPETYDWARKMAVDALEYDESADDANPSSAISEILVSPERLKDLDLDAFAEELERQGYGNKGITLYDIRNELNSRYKDFRYPYRPPSLEEKFQLVTKESVAAFSEGKLVTCSVSAIAYRKPKVEQLEQAEPHKDEESGMWTCSFCKTGGFAELSEVWSHLDNGECLGRAVGVRTRFENGISGFIPTDKLSDKPVNNPEDRVKPGMTIHCRIMKIDIERFQADLSSRGSDLRDETGRWRPQLDAYYDHEEELVDKQKMTDKSKDSNRTTYIKRVIAHPSFHNIDFKAAERMMADLDQGDTVIRPSSKGCDHLTASWKVAEGPVCAHIDIREEKKENNFSLGRSLWIGPEEFEDLDEIIARFIQPMAANARDLIAHKNYRDVGGKKELVEDMLKQAKKQAPSRIPYFISASKALPGKFLLSYMPRTRSKHEYVSVTSDGYRYRAQMFTSLNHLFKWFKEHFRDPIPNHLLPHTPPATSSSHHVTPSTHHVTPSSHHVTPSSHHKTSSKSASSRLTPRTPYFTPNPNPGAGMDWGKAAQEWAKSSRAMPPSPLLTPRGPRTPKEPPSRTPKQHHHRTRAQPSGY